MHGYWALLHRDARSWGISFPDVPGCISAGSSLEETLDEGQKALSAHLALLKADDDAIPRARSFDELSADPDTRDDAVGATWHRVVPRHVQAPRQRVNIMIEPGLLHLTDTIAESEGRTRSGVIEDALSAWVGRDVAAEHIRTLERVRRSVSRGSGPRAKRTA